jgi:hypothetical protein
VFGQHRASVREAITKLKERIVRLEVASRWHGDDQADGGSPLGPRSGRSLCDPRRNGRR